MIPGGGGGTNEPVVVEGGSGPYLNIIQLAFGAENNESKFTPATNLNYDNDNNDITSKDDSVFTLNDVTLPGSQRFCTKRTNIQEDDGIITADGVTWGMNKPEFPRFAIIDVFAARLPDTAFTETNMFMSKMRSATATAKQEAMPRFRPTRLIFIAGMYPNIGDDTTTIPSGRGNICGNQDDIRKETSAGGGLCISFAIVNNNDLRFIAAKAVRYMFRYQPNSEANFADSIGICTLDDNPCGTTGRGGASALSAHGFSFLYKTKDVDTNDEQPVEFGFIDSIGGMGRLSGAAKTAGAGGSSPYQAQLFFMNLVNDYINRKSLTAEPPKITKLVESRYMQFLNWAADRAERGDAFGRITGVATTASIAAARAAGSSPGRDGKEIRDEQRRLDPRFSAQNTYEKVPGAAGDGRRVPRRG